MTLFTFFFASCSFLLLLPATSHHCPARLATLFLVQVTTSYDWRVFSWLEKQLYCYFCQLVTIRSELGIFVPGVMLESPGKQSDWVMGTGLENQQEMQQFTFPDFSAPERDLVLVFLLFCHPIGFFLVFPPICVPHDASMEVSMVSWTPLTPPMVKSVLPQLLAGPHHLQLFLILTIADHLLFR